MSDLVVGFAPYFNEDSEILVLGSFPSVKSRAQNFYYGNPQNSFWRILACYFGEPTPQTVEEKKALLKSRKIALWDIVTECEIVGSQDATIKNFKVANLADVFTKCKIKAILINGGTAYSIFKKRYPSVQTPVYKLPSTSPANTRPKEKEWNEALRRALG